MFNPSQEDSNPEKIWELMGTFFALLSQADKKVFENYFESLSRVNSGLSYSLLQAESLRYLEDQKGWFELLYKEYPLVKTDNEGLGRETLTKDFLKVPTNLTASPSAGGNVYAYKITALNSNGETSPSQIIKVENASTTVSLS